jgi:hypothetical protein
MSGYSTVLKVRRLEEAVDKLGFRMAHPRYQLSNSDTVVLYPKDADAVPVYSRDAEVFEGSLEALDIWLRGFQTARDYDMMLFGVKHDDARKNREQKILNKQLLQKIKEAGQEEEA